MCAAQTQRAPSPWRRPGLRGSRSNYCKVRSPCESVRSNENLSEGVQFKDHPILSYHLNTFDIVIYSPGDEEKKYWDKVMADRERKLSKPRNKKRGLTKVRVLSASASMSACLTWPYSGL